MVHFVTLQWTMTYRFQLIALMSLTLQPSRRCPFTIPVGHRRHALGIPLADTGIATFTPTTKLKSLNENIISGIDLVYV